MKIKTKVLLGFSIMPLVILIFIGIGWYQIHSINKATEQMQTKYLMVYAAGEIQREIKNVAIGLRNIMIYADQEDIQLEIHTLQSESESINQNIRSLEGYALTEEQKKRVGELKETNLRFMEYKDKMIDLVNQGQEQTAIALMNSESKPLQDQYFQGISHLYESFQKDMGTSFDLISKDFRQKLFWGILISLGCLILGLGFLIRGIWNATTRLNQVSSVILGVSNGTLVKN
ncbi:MCP four helix bundle domain-containing protein [Ammoniphilus sp. 3BR4]|uniref:MCP four helix bundle domain-containing protein n=1 Tax=Ammoniphilus sp. 3BR4 TaxID=3158265 RepID=UPI003465C303